MMSWKIVSDGLGDFSGVSQTLHLGGKKNLKRRHFYSCFLPVLFMSLLNVSTYNIFCESIIISLQRSHEIYRDIKCPHAHIISASFESNLTLSIKLFLASYQLFFVHGFLFSYLIVEMFILIRVQALTMTLLMFHNRIVMIHLECYRIT